MGYPEKILEKERKIGLLQRQNFQKAVRAGAKQALTDVSLLEKIPFVMKGGEVVVSR